MLLQGSCKDIEELETLVKNMFKQSRLIEDGSTPFKHGQNNYQSRAFSRVYELYEQDPDKAFFPDSVPARFFYDYRINFATVKISARGIQAVVLVTQSTQVLEKMDTLRKLEP